MLLKQFNWEIGERLCCVSGTVSDCDRKLHQAADIWEVLEAPDPQLEFITEPQT